jgi:LysR family transcriptional regulator, hydrogen peroxide-inducible genes activator
LAVNLRDLEYAVCLAGEGQFRRAAARCHVSQPTLSAQIAKLEDELGVQLFERGPRAATPTVNGRSLLRQAQVVLDEVERLRALARAGQDPLQGPFHLGVIPTAGPYLLPLLLPALREGWPQLQLLLREAQTAALVERLRAGSLDAAILSLPLDADDLRGEPLLSEPILVALPSGHRLAQQKRITPGSLASESILLLEEGHCLRDRRWRSATTPASPTTVTMCRRPGWRVCVRWSWPESASRLFRNWRRSLRSAPNSWPSTGVSSRQSLSASCC